MMKMRGKQFCPLAVDAFIRVLQSTGAGEGITHAPAAAPAATTQTAGSSPTAAPAAEPAATPKADAA
jgi:HD-GYP domain-containing protein (c-di-GMP phosphodiesterase class II)